MLTKNLSKMEDVGWIGAANSRILQILVSGLCTRKGYTVLQKAGAMNQTELEGALKCAMQAIEGQWNAKIDLEHPEIFEIAREKQ